MILYLFTELWYLQHTNSCCTAFGIRHACHFQIGLNQADLSSLQGDISKLLTKRAHDRDPTAVLAKPERQDLMACSVAASEAGRTG